MVYTRIMLSGITLDRRKGNGKYADVLDVAERLAQGDYATATNAFVVMVRQSLLFRATLQKMQTEKRDEKDEDSPRQDRQG